MYSSLDESSGTTVIYITQLYSLHMSHKYFYGSSIASQGDPDPAAAPDTDLSFLWSLKITQIYSLK